MKIYFFNNYKLTVLRTVTSKPQRTFFKLLNFQIRNFRLSFYSYVQHKLCHFLTLIFVFSTGQDNIWPPIFRFFCAWRRNIKNICSIYNIITLNIVINCTSVFKKGETQQVLVVLIQGFSTWALLTFGPDNSLLWGLT